MVEEIECMVHSFVAGVDEAGRGPLAGPVIAGAVILAPGQNTEGLTDSKKLSEKKRDYWYNRLREESFAWALGCAQAHEIDALNILQASLLAMKRAVLALSPLPTMIKVDGNQTLDLSMPCEAIIKGDLTVPAISAASVIAKVTRDREMVALSIKYPEYGFAQHKGYPTRLHKEALKKWGPCLHHRKSFSPISELLES
jgi:ribonuclease HII